MGIGEASAAREVPAQGMCKEIREHPQPYHMAHDHHHQQQQQQQQHHHIATTAFHISRPSHLISPPPLHHTSIILDEDSVHVSRIMLQNESFQVIYHHYQSNEPQLILLI